jgi:hypothetical protein
MSSTDPVKPAANAAPACSLAESLRLGKARIRREEIESWRAKLRTLKECVQAEITKNLRPRLLGMANRGKDRDDFQVAVTIYRRREFDWREGEGGPVVGTFTLTNELGIIRQALIVENGLVAEGIVLGTLDYEPHYGGAHVIFTASIIDPPEPEQTGQPANDGTQDGAPMDEGGGAADATSVQVGVPL